MIVLKAVSWSSITTSRSKYFWYSSLMRAFSSNDFLMSSSWKRKAWGKRGEFSKEITHRSKALLRSVYVQRFVQESFAAQCTFLFSFSETNRRIWKIYVHNMCRRIRSGRISADNEGGDERPRRRMFRCWRGSRMASEVEVSTRKHSRPICSLPARREGKYQDRQTALWSHFAPATGSIQFTVICLSLP